MSFLRIALEKEALCSWPERQERFLIVVDGVWGRPALLGVEGIPVRGLLPACPCPLSIASYQCMPGDAVLRTLVMLPS